MCNKNYDAEQVARLADAFLSLSTREECFALFDDIFTVKELEDISSRLEVARQLKEGRNYNDIAASTGASTATISRVSKCLAGDRGGYRTVLERTSENADMKLDISALGTKATLAVRALVACLSAEEK